MPKDLTVTRDTTDSRTGITHCTIRPSSDMLLSEYVAGMAKFTGVTGLELEEAVEAFLMSPLCTNDNAWRLHNSNLAVARVPVVMLGFLVAIPALADSRRPLAGDVDCDGHTDAITHAVSPGTVSVEVRFGQNGRAAQ